MKETEKILHAEIGYINPKFFKGNISVIGSLGKLRGVALTDSQRHGIRPSGTGLIWVDEESAAELGLIPREYLKDPEHDDAANKFLQELVVDKKQTFFINIKHNPDLVRAVHNIDEGDWDFTSSGYYASKYKEGKQALKPNLEAVRRTDELTELFTKEINICGISFSNVCKSFESFDATRQIDALSSCFGTFVAILDFFFINFPLADLLS